MTKRLELSHKEGTSLRVIVTGIPSGSTYCSLKGPGGVLLMHKLKGVLGNSQRTNFDFIKGTIKKTRSSCGKVSQKGSHCIQDKGSLEDAQSPENTGD